MRTRLLLMGVAGLALALGAGDALSRQAAAPGAKPPPPRLNAAATRANAAGASTTQPSAPPAAGSGIDWKSVVVAQRRSNAAGLGDKLAAGLDQSEVDKTALPILLPTEPGLVASGRLYSFGDYYTLSADTPGASLSFSGTASPIKVDAPLTVTAEGPENLIITRTVEGRIASYTRYGVLYTVEIACDSPKDDRCVADNYIRNLAAKTNAVVLGKAARKAAGMGG
jgi:hypothetical protein